MNKKIASIFVASLVIVVGIGLLQNLHCQAKRLTHNELKENNNFQIPIARQEQPYLNDIFKHENQADWDYVNQHIDDAIAGKIPGLSSNTILELICAQPRTLEKAGNLSRAVKVYRKLYGDDLKGADPKEICHLADLLDYMGDKAQAKIVYLQYLKTKPRTFEVGWVYSPNLNLNTIYPPDKLWVSQKFKEFKAETTLINGRLDLYPHVDVLQSYEIVKGLANFYRSQDTQTEAEQFVRLRIALRAMPDDPVVNLAYAELNVDYLMNHTALIYFARAEKFGDDNFKFVVWNTRWWDKAMKYYKVIDEQKYRTVTDPKALADANAVYRKTHPIGKGAGYTAIVELHVPDGVPAVHFYKTINSPIWKDVPMPKIDVNTALGLPLAVLQPQGTHKP